jgi:hypothetical protein
MEQKHGGRKRVNNRFKNKYIKESGKFADILDGVFLNMQEANHY